MRKYGVNVLDSAQSDDCLRLLDARYALNTRQKALKCLGTLRHNLHQVIEIAGKIETLQNLILCVDKAYSLPLFAATLLPATVGRARALCRDAILDI